MADGTLKFDTKIDESGFKKGIESIESQGQESAEKVSKSWKKLGDDIQNSTKQTQSNFSSVFSNISKIGTSTFGAIGTIASTAFDLAKKATLAYTGALTAGAVAGVKYNATIESLQTSFEVMTGSAEKAVEITERLKEIGAKTPYEVVGLAETVQGLMQYGAEADYAIEITQMLGDAAQGNSQKLSQIALAYGQMMSTGTATWEDLKQMIEAGFNPLNDYAEAVGMTTEEIMELAKNGQLSFEQVTEAIRIATSEGGTYYQSSEKQAQTLTGKISTLIDTLNDFLGSATQPLYDFIKDDIVPQVTASIENLKTILSEQGESAFVDGLGGALQYAVIKLADIIKNNAPKLIQYGLSLMNDITTGILSAIPTLIPVAFEVINNFISGLNRNLPTLLDYAQRIIDTLLQGITENADMIIDGALQIINTLVMFLLKNIPQILIVGIQVLLELINGITENLPIMLPTILDTIIFIVEELIKQAPLLAEASLQLIIALANALIQYLPTLLEKLPTIIESLVSTLVSYSFKLVEAGLKLIVSLGIGLIQAVPQLLSSVTSIIGSMFNGFLNGIGSFFDIGKKIVENIGEGVVAMRNWLWNKITGIFSGIGNFVSSAIGNVGSSISGVFTGRSVMATNSNYSPTYNNYNTSNSNVLNFNQPVQSPDEIARKLRIDTKMGRVY